MNDRELFEAWFNEYHSNNEAYSKQIAWDAWQACTNRKGYKLVPTQPSEEVICAIENKVQEQLEASAIDADMFRLDGERIFEAMIGAAQ